MKHSLFVYGTLLGRLTPSPTPATVRGTMYNLGAFPGVLITEPTTTIQGELHLIDDDELSRLDHYEGVDVGLYSRERVDVTLDGSSTEAWIYTINPIFVKQIGARIIPNGNWRTR